MKTQIIKLVARRIAASLAIVVALATSSAWASNAWIGEGVDEYFDTANNKTGGPAGRGIYFVDGVIPNGSTEPLQVSNWTVRFNSYTRIAGASIYVGRACLTDTDKIWTVIADNDDCGFYLDNAYNLEVGRNTSESNGYFRIMNGKYSVNNVYIGPNANDPTVEGVLSIGSDGHTSTLTAAGNIEIRNGDLTTTNTAVTCGTLTAANKNNSTATIDKTGGNWTVNGNLAMNTADGTTAVFYNRGGNLVVTNDLTVQNRGSGEFYMEGGHVTVSNIVRFADYYLSSGNKANLYLNGGVFEAKAFRFHNCDYSTGNVIFNGGTYKALADGDIAVHEGRMGYGYLRFKVGAQGGTIDTAGHDVISPFQLLQDGSSTGGLCVKGGGSLTLENANVTYTGKTCIEAGTMLVVSNSTVKSNILSHGIELVGAPTLNTEYTVFRCNDDLDAETDLANVTCPVAESFTPSIGTDGKSIVVTVTALKSGNVWTGAKDNNLSDSANWLGGNVPTSGNAEIYCPVATTLTVGDTFSPDTITIPDASSVVTIGAGDLHVNTLTNASKLAIGAGASLEVDGDLVTIPYYRVSRTILYSNDGTVVVHGKVIGVDNGNEGKIYEYQTTSANTKPIRTSGLVYEGHKNRMYFHPGGSASGAIGKWVIGKDGLSFNGLGSVDYSCFWAYNAEITFGSSANWTLENSMGNSTSYGDLKVSNGASVTLDTSDYSNPTVPRTITLEGRLCALNIGMSKSACVIDGCGTVIVDTKDMSSVTGIADPLKHTCITNSILQVKSGATLQVNAGKKITGANGRIALDAGATLALVSGGTDDFVTRIEPAVTLPTDGVATIRIDGERLRGGDHTIATVASGTTANVTLDPASTALDGRKGSLRVDGSNLVLNIEPTGAMVIVF